MGAGGCISTQQTQKKGLEGAQDIIVGNHVRGEHEFKDGAAVIWASQSIQGFCAGAKGVAGGTYVSIKSERQQTHKKQQAKSINKQIHRQLESGQNAKRT